MLGAISSYIVPLYIEILWYYAVKWYTHECLTKCKILHTRHWAHRPFNEHFWNAITCKFWCVHKILIRVTPSDAFYDQLMRQHFQPGGFGGSGTHVPWLQSPDCTCITLLYSVFCQVCCVIVLVLIKINNKSPETWTAQDVVCNEVNIPFFGVTAHLTLFSNTNDRITICICIMGC